MKTLPLKYEFFSLKIIWVFCNGLFVLLTSTEIQRQFLKNVKSVIRLLETMLVRITIFTVCLLPRNVQPSWIVREES